MRRSILFLFHRNDNCLRIANELNWDADLIAAPASSYDSAIWPNKPYDVIWATPPCKTFSVASIGHHWKNGNPSEEAIGGNRYLMKCLEIINISQPKVWWIENPVGMMRKLPIMRNLANRYSLTMCQYGDTRRKPTDIWTNIKQPHLFQEMCKNGDPCHQAAPRGSATGTQGRRTSKERALIPDALIEHILEESRRAIQRNYSHL